jgi:hypothetical protein
MIYIHTKLHIPSSIGSLVIAVKLKANENPHTAAIATIYNFRTLHQVLMMSLRPHTSVRTSAMLCLLI